jgi:MoaA/NifB/PqqE/SkfB family radical SAM enzyme
MCLTWATEPSISAMTPEQVGDVLVQIPKLTWLDLTGGEIFIRADAEQIFERVVENTPALRMLHFPTNGWFGDRTVEVARALRSRRPEVDLIITVSIDGPPAVHDQIRGREGSFERALDTFERLREIDGVGVYVGTTVTAKNQEVLDELESILQSRIEGFSAREWHWNWLQESEHFFKNGEVEDLEPKATLGLVQRHLQRRGWPRNPVELMEFGFLTTLERYQKGEATGIGCQSLRSTCFISPEGDLYPCHVWDRPLGNLLETPLAELWYADETLKARDEVKRLACGGCFTPCEAYPALVGSPITASVKSLEGLARVARESLTMG